MAFRQHSYIESFNSLSHGLLVLHFMFFNLANIRAVFELIESLLLRSVYINMKLISLMFTGLHICPRLLIRTKCKILKEAIRLKEICPREREYFVKQKYLFEKMCLLCNE